MNYPNTPEYRFDLSGVHPDNLIRDERILLDVVDTPIIVPRHAPFYMESLRIMTKDGLLLTKDTDYRFFIIDQDLTRYTGQPVSFFIEFLNDSLTEVYVTYQTPGSVSLAGTTLYDLYETVNVNDKPVDWKDIKNKPPLFDPKLHGHDVAYQLYGFKGMADALAKLIDWVNPPATYRKNDPTFVKAYNLMTNNNVGITAKLASGDIFPIRISVDQNTIPLTFPAPHLSFFIQRIKNALTFVNNYVQSYTQELQSHISNMKNPHGNNRNSVGLGNRDNFKILTLANDADNKNYSEKKLITPAWFASVLDGYKGRTDNYVEPGKLPLVYFGDNTYIPPVVDSKVNGLGIASGYGVMCLERGGWLSVILNANDPDTDTLVYLKLKGYEQRNFNLDNFGGIVAQTKYLYRPKYFVDNNINLNAVIKGGDYRYIVVGDTRTNKWFLVKTNNTFNQVNHTVYPITFPVNWTKTQVSALQMCVTDNTIFFTLNDLTINSKLDLTLLSLPITNLGTTNTVNYLNVQTIDQNNTASVGSNGSWRPFPYVTDSNGLVTQWMGNFTTPLKQAFNNRGVVALFKVDPNGKDVYLRLYIEPTFANDLVSVIPVFSVVFKLIQNGNTYTPSILKGKKGLSFDINKWQNNKDDVASPNLSDTTNSTFFKEFLDYFPSAAINPANASSWSRLSNGDWVTLGSLHWTFYPLYMVSMKSNLINLDDLTTFQTTQLLRGDAGVVSDGYINNIGPSNISSYLACHSNLKTQADANNDYELMRSELGGSRYQTLARKRSGNRNQVYTAPSGSQWNRMNPTSDIRKTSIPENCFRMSLVDERTTTGNGETIFGVLGYNARSLTGDNAYAVNYDYQVDLVSDPNLITIKETRRLVFPLAVIKKLLGQLSPNAVYDGEQANWNLYWTSNHGNQLAPIIIGSWLENINGVNTQRLGVANINSHLDFTDKKLYSAGKSGVLEYNVQLSDVDVNSKVITNIKTFSSDVDNSHWVKKNVAHVQPGQATIYINQQGEITFYANTSIYLSPVPNLDQGWASVPWVAVKLTDYLTFSGDILSGSSSWDMSSNAVNALKGIGLLLNGSVTTPDFIGGSVYPAYAIGNNWQSLVNNYWGNNTGKTGYHLFDLRLSTNFNLYLTADFNVVLNGANRLLKAQRLDLTSIKPNPANTTFYLYLEEQEGGAVLNARTSPASESGRLTYIGMAITNNSSITSIIVNPTFTMNGYRISDQPIGSAIPSSSGDVTTAGTFAW